MTCTKSSSKPADLIFSVATLACLGEYSSVMTLEVKEPDCFAALASHSVLSIHT
jgi:hypothetical protein